MADIYIRAKWLLLTLSMSVMLTVLAQDNGGVEPQPLPDTGNGGAAVEAGDDTANLNPDQIKELELVRRQEQLLRADENVSQAKDAIKKKDFETARDLLVKAEQILTGISGMPEAKTKLDNTRELLALTFEQWADYLVEQAQKDMESSKFEDATRKYQEAANYNPKLKPEMAKKIKAMNIAKEKTQFLEDTREDKVDPEKAERDKDIQLLLEQGRVFYRHKRYMDAREKFEQVLIRDPYNRESTRYLQQIYESISADAKERRWAMIKERAAEIEWKWVDPVAPLDRPTNPVDITNRRDRGKDDEKGIRYKLENIIIPKISFEEATIYTVVRFLKERSKDLDIEGEGVNIFLRLKNPNETAAPAQEAAPAAPAADDFSFDTPAAAPAAPAAGTGPADFDFEGDGALTGDLTNPPATKTGGGGGTDSGELTITMDFDNIPLGEAIRYICQGAGLKYRIEPYAVIIADPSVALQEMETRFYPIDAGVINQKVTRAKKGGFSDDDDDDDSGSGQEVDPEEFFSKLGVTFPEGARISHDPRTSKLIVYNTPENLRKVEEILAELNIQPTQVTIEAKFVEVRQTTLNQIGFKWLFQGKRQGDGSLGDYNTNFLGTDLTVFAQPDSDGSSLSNGIDASVGAVSKGSLLGVQTILNNLQFKTLIYALDQSDGNDLLSAPKVTTISGVTAVIDFVQERRFPESFTEPEITTSSGGQVSISPSTPEFGESEEIGVIFRVTPTVAADGYSIDLELEPVVREFIGYDTTFNTQAVINTEAGQTSVPFRFDTPIFEKRSIETRVIVWDGETVVLGGTIRDSVSKRNDKVPYLSKIPLIGKLFKMDGELSEKRNLLVFVTARLVNPAGLPIRPQDIRGLPDFRR